MFRNLSAAILALILATAASAAGRQAPSAARPAAPGQTVTRPPAKVLPGTRSSVFTVIQGNVLSSTNEQMPGALVRLRDARFGRVVDTQITDKSGMFAFRTVDPGSYIVELMGLDQSILATSQILTVNAGEAVSAIVKLPLHVPPFAGLMGNAPSAAALATQAAASGIAAVIPTAPVSPVQ